MNTNIFFPVCESAYTDSLIGFHPNPRMGVGYVWRTYVCYIGAYLGEKRACFVCGIRVVYFGEYTWGLYLWVYTWGCLCGVRMWVMWCMVMMWETWETAWLRGL